MSAKTWNMRAAAAFLLVCAASPAGAQTGGFLERDRSGAVVAPKPAGVRQRPAARRGGRTRPAARTEPALEPPVALYPVDEEAEAARPTADAVLITGKQGAGQVKPIIYVKMGESSILQCVLSPGRLTQINLFGDVADIAFSDYERFRVGYKNGVFFVSPGTQDSALVDWKAVRADLAVIMQDGRQYHFEFQVVDASRASHRVINVNAPAPRREPTEAEIEQMQAERERERVEQERLHAQQEAEALARTEQAAARAAAQPVAGKARKGPMELTVSQPLVVDGRVWVRFVVANSSKQPRAATITAGAGAGVLYQAEVRMRSPLVEGRSRTEGLVVFDEAALLSGAPLVVTAATPGEKAVEYRFENGTLGGATP